MDLFHQLVRINSFFLIHHHLRVAVTWARKLKIACMYIVETFFSKALNFGANYMKILQFFRTRMVESE